MDNKLISIKKGNNVFLFKLNYNIEEFLVYSKYLDKMYRKDKNVTIITKIIDGKVLSYGDYDYLKDEYIVDDEYQIIDKNYDKKNKLVKIKTKVHAKSIISTILKNTFCSENLIIDFTDFIKLYNQIYGYNNNFFFDEIIDLNKKNLSFDDPGRLIINENEYNKYKKYKTNKLNENLKLNSLEEKDKMNIMNDVLNKISTSISFEQVGMFPIDMYNDNVYSIYIAYGKRNADIDYIINDIVKAPINLNGTGYVLETSKEILETHKINHNEEKIIVDFKKYQKCKNDKKLA